MKIKYLAILFVAFLTFTSCKTDPKKTKSIIKEKTSGTEVIPVEKKKVEEKPFTYGIDVSHYQGDEVDFMNRHKDSLNFIICKATEGVFYTDPKFRSNWETIRENGFIRGTYHFFISRDNAVTQAEHFINAISNIEDTDIPPIIDFESGGIDKNQSVQEIQHSLLTFIQTVENRLNRKPIIYTDIPVANQYLNDTRFAEYALWIANYNGKSKPDLPETWETKGWTFWQRNADYTIDNIKNDSDVFHGNVNQLRAFIANYK